MRTAHLPALVVLLALSAPQAALAADSAIRMQCPTTTELHPDGTGIVCKHLSSGDGMVTMADDNATPMYIFGFNDLSTGGPRAIASKRPIYPPITLSRYSLSQPALMRFVFTPTFREVSCLRRLRAMRRMVAKFSAE